MERRCKFLIPYRLWVGKGCRQIDFHVCPSFESGRQQTGGFPESSRIDCTGEAKIWGKQESHSFWGDEAIWNLDLPCAPRYAIVWESLATATHPPPLSLRLSQLFPLLPSVPSTRVAQPRKTSAVILQYAVPKCPGCAQHHQVISQPSFKQLLEPWHSFYEKACKWRDTASHPGKRAQLEKLGLVGMKASNPGKLWPPAVLQSSSHLGQCNRGLWKGESQSWFWCSTPQTTFQCKVSS